ncbi:MAG: hypothetical protein IPI77_21855 [Saprospiraceae bacterium]|nr:hypothetical protein [Saprospiraceae bacterium]
MVKKQIAKKWTINDVFISLMISNHVQFIKNSSLIFEFSKSDVIYCAPIKSIQKQVKTIHIYELIKSTLPYIEALNSNLLIHIISFVNDLCTKIDLSGRDYDEIFPDSQKIEQLFKPYFELVQPAQGNGDMFKECYERIENLYTELKKLDSE